MTKTIEGMRVGLLTIHDTCNYGSLLQTISLYRALRKLDLNVKVIDYKNKAISKREAPKPLSQAKTFKEIIQSLLWHKKLQRRYDKFKQQLHDSLALSQEYTLATIAQANDEFDVFIVGSDIVWGSEITGRDKTYFLDFAEDKKIKFAFSSSVGTKWAQTEEREVAALLKRFDKISVREELAAGWIKDLIGESVDVTCDPTMLWTSEAWKSDLNHSIVPKKDYVLIYMTTKDRRTISDAIAYAKKNNLEIYYINYYSKIKGTKSIRPDTVEEWLALIFSAKAVFTASYHGLLFSLYFRKNVFYYNRGNTSRMISLAKELNIESREGTAENIQNDIKINYDMVDDLIEKKREYSWSVLENYFSGNLSDEKRL